jgi:fibronectin type 3 domain-containing protein
VSLSWAETSSVIGYYVYRGAQATGPFSKLNSSPDPATVYTDSSVTSGQTYYYVTTAVDSSGLETVYSNVAQATVP